MQARDTAKLMRGGKKLSELLKRKSHMGVSFLKIPENQRQKA